MHEAIKILHRDHPEIIVDGELQANFALNTKKRMKQFPFTKIGKKDVNTLIFPNLSSGNIAYKMLQEIGNSEAIGPVLLGMKKPIHPIQIDASVREIVNMTAIAVVDAQNVRN
jgi:malate dehydrogenase (oxaloacetate-decarboxylating)(NADP+)